MPKGYLALILHAHLPFVRHPEHEHFLEEDWLYEAITETYLPLLDLFERLVAEQIRFQLAVTLSPPLIAMLSDALLRRRYERYLERTIALAEEETHRTRNEPALLEVARMYLDRLIRARSSYVDRWGRDLVKAFARLETEGCLEILTCAATHGFLPLLAPSSESVRAQVTIGCRAHTSAIGHPPRGIWLPECAYVPGIETVLAEAGLRWFVLDSHGLLLGRPRPRFGIFAPVFTPAGPAAFARDRESSRQVWSAEQGYPGDPTYRDFYRDIGFDLSLEYLRPFLPDGLRRFTGLKYHRITGKTGPKEIYRRDQAMATVERHAQDFVANRRAQVAALEHVLPAPPLVLSPFDAELFGHWWFEGPEFLERVLRFCAERPQELELIHPAEYLNRHPRHQICTPAPSSWGNQGYWEVWLDDSNSWIYPHLHECARRMTAAARRGPLPDGSGERERLLCQMGRELLLAQSSDWAFLMRTNTARAYAEARTRRHLHRFLELHRRFEQAEPGGELLARFEAEDNLFPDLDWRAFA